MFNQIEVGSREPQRLLNPKVPSYNFDIISGLTYDIDLSKPARYAGAAQPSSEQHRILNVSFKGKPIDSNVQFLVVTNNYRADGGGNFPALASTKVVLRAPDTNREQCYATFAQLRA